MFNLMLFLVIFSSCVREVLLLLPASAVAAAAATLIRPSLPRYLTLLTPSRHHHPWPALVTPLPLLPSPSAPNLLLLLLSCAPAESVQPSSSSPFGKRENLFEIGLDWF